MRLQRICECVQKSSNKPSTRKKTSNHKFKRSSQPISHTSHTESDLKCPHFTNCPGCTLENNLNNPTTLDRARQFFNKPTLPLYVGNIHHWRHRSRLAIRSNNNGLLDAGLFQQGSHSLVPIPQCKVQHPSLNKCATAVLECARATGTQPYNEATGVGDLRYIQMTIADCTNNNNSINDDNKLIQLILVWNGTGSISPRLAALVDTLTSTYSHCLHSIWVNFNTSRTNTILGSEYLHIWGDEEAWTTVGDTSIAFSPGSFLQANPEAMAAAIESIRRYIPTSTSDANGKGIHIVDLYAGVGTLGLAVAKQLLNNDKGEDSSWIRFVEIVPWAQQPFELSSARLISERGSSSVSKAHSMKMEYHVSSAGTDPQQWLHDATVVLCDPPRKGLDKKLLDVLCDESSSNSSSVSPLQRIVYLSCGYDALERDCRKLVGSKQWMIQHVEAFLFFPGTEHIETLVVLDRVT